MLPSFTLPPEPRSPASFMRIYLDGVLVASAVGTLCRDRCANKRAAPGIICTSPHLALSCTSVSARSSAAVILAAVASRASRFRSRVSMSIWEASRGRMPRTDCMAPRTLFSVGDAGDGGGKGREGNVNDVTGRTQSTFFNFFFFSMIDFVRFRGSGRRMKLAGEDSF